MKRYELLINGRNVKPSSRKYFIDFNPATLKPIAKFPLGNEKDLETAITAAKKALSRWKNTPAPRRGQILLKIAEIMKERKQKLAKSITEEMGKVLKETLGDVQEGIDIFEYMAGEGRRLFGKTTPSEMRNKSCYTIRQPIGVVGLITPWNFPIAIPSWKLAPALICGNTCVIKPSSDTPRAVYSMLEIFKEAGIPGGVVNIVTGKGDAVGAALIKHPEVNAISFTGSRDTGLYITKNAGIKKVGLELGGKNAILVMEDADINNAIEGILWGAFGTSGQRCTATSRLLVHKKIKKKLLNKLLTKTKKLRLGNGLNKKTDVGPLINKKAVEKVQRYVDIGKKEGKLLCGGFSPKINGHFYSPTIFEVKNTNKRIAQEEIFGPFLTVITIKNIQEAIKKINNTKYGLSSSIYTKSIVHAMKAIEEIETGIVYINSPTIGAEVHLPFGGIKQTGNGTREAGIMGIEEFSEIKTVYIDYSGKLQKAQIDKVE